MKNKKQKKKKKDGIDFADILEAVITALIVLAGKILGKKTPK